MVDKWIGETESKEGVARRSAMLKSRYAALKHPRMKALMALGKATDVSVFPKLNDDTYVLPSFDEDKIPIDAFFQTWINFVGRARRSVGVPINDGTVRILPAGSLVATWGKHIYTEERFECLFRR